MKTAPVPPVIAPYRAGLIAAATAFLALGMLFAALPQLDLDIAAAFYLGDGRFAFNAPSLADYARTTLRYIFRAAVVLSVLGVALAVLRGYRLFGRPFRDWVFALAAFTLGVGLVTGVLLKGLWGRARPQQVAEFGGTAQFTPPWLPTDQCGWNCSFVSGEASNIFMLGFILVLVLAPHSPVAWMGAVAAGLFSGFIRVGAGGHFASDVTMAGPLMLAVALGIHVLTHRRWRAAFDEKGVVMATLRSAAGGWRRR